MGLHHLPISARLAQPTQRSTPCHAAATTRLFIYRLSPPLSETPPPLNEALQTMAAPAGRGQGRGRGRGQGWAPFPTITWPGSFGPTEYDPPLDQVPLEEHQSFLPPQLLRPYDNRNDAWPQCHHKKPCVMQMYDEWGDCDRRFFICPIGLVSNIVPLNYSYCMG